MLRRLPRRRKKPNAYNAYGINVEYNLPKLIAHCVDKHLQNKPNLLSLFIFLLALLQLFFEVYFGNLIHHEIDAQIQVGSLVQLVYRVLRQIDVFNVDCQSVQVDKVCANRGLFHAHFSGDIARFARGSARVTLKLVKVRVVYVAVHLCTRAPAECGMTARAPHLIAPRNLVNELGATRTLFAIILQKCHRLLVLVPAHVSVFFECAPWRVAL